LNGSVLVNKLIWDFPEKRKLWSLQYFCIVSTNGIHLEWNLFV